MAIKSGQIVIFRFPQTDLIVGKMRPALVLANLPANQNDWLVCMISSQLRQALPDIDETIEATDADFSQTSLKSASVIRLTRLAVAEETIFTGTIGEISANRLAKLKKSLSEWIEKN